MNVEEIEAELLQTRAGEAPQSIEARLLESARRLRIARRPILPTLLALAAASAFFALLAVVLRSDGQRMSPGGSRQETPVERWTYTIQKTDAATGREGILAILRADSAAVKLVGGKAMVQARGLTTQVFSNGSYTFTSTSGHFDERSGQVVLDGDIRVERADGFTARVASASVDLESETFQMSIDVLARLGDHLNKYSQDKSRPARNGPLPKMKITALKGASRGTTTTFDHPRIQWDSPIAEAGVPPFSIQYSGVEGRSDEEAYTVSGDARAIFEDDRVVQALEVAWKKATNVLRLKISLK